MDFVVLRVRVGSDNNVLNPGRMRCAWGKCGPAKPRAAMHGGARRIGRVERHVRA